METSRTVWRLFGLENRTWWLFSGHENQTWWLSPRWYWRWVSWMHIMKWLRPCVQFTYVSALKTELDDCLYIAAGNEQWMHIISWTRPRAAFIFFSALKMELEDIGCLYIAVGDEPQGWIWWSDPDLLYSFPFFLSAFKMELDDCLHIAARWRWASRTMY